MATGDDRDLLTLLDVFDLLVSTCVARGLLPPSMIKVRCCKFVCTRVHQR